MALEKYIIKWAKRKDKNQSPLEFYLEHHFGIDRTTLHEIDIQLLLRLKKSGGIDEVP